MLGWLFTGTSVILWEIWAISGRGETMTSACRRIRGKRMWFGTMVGLWIVAGYHLFFEREKCHV